MENQLANIPPVDQILMKLQREQMRCERKYIKKLIQEEILIIHNRIKKDKTEILQRDDITTSILQAVTRKLDALTNPSLIRVINATGIVLHTGLGRAPLSNPDIKELQTIARYTNLEFNLTSGKRGERLDHVEDLLKLLTDCQAAVVVNNNAAAVLLVLNTLSRGRAKEVIISRGEQIEIGGSFRLPDVMRNSGAKMIEVGTTNKTHLADYAQAINEKTAAILVVHPSNYQVMGFTAKAALPELVDLAHRHALPVIFDLGSGVLIDMQQYGFDKEPVVEQMHQIGIDVITFSGDKLLGGPQAGIITGNRDILNKIRKNSLLRALRCDKITLALLNTTLRKYLKSETLQNTNVALSLLTRSVESQRKTAKKIDISMRNIKNMRCEIKEEFGRVGSGAYPLAEVPACTLVLKYKNWTPEKTAHYFRQQAIPIIGYIQNDTFRLNMLTISDEESEIIITTLKNLQ